MSLFGENNTKKQPPHAAVSAGLDEVQEPAARHSEICDEGRIEIVAPFLEVCFERLSKKHINRPSFNVEIFRRAMALLAESFDPDKLLTKEDPQEDPALFSILRDVDQEGLFGVYAAWGSALSLNCQDRKNEIALWLRDLDVKSITSDDRWDARGKNQRFFNAEDYARDKNELKARWEEIAGYWFLSHGASIDDDAGSFHDYLMDRTRLIEKSAGSMSIEDLIEAMASAMARSLDPFSDVKIKDPLNARGSAYHQLFGIGVELRIEGRRVYVDWLVPGGPAERQGQLKVGDEILAAESDGKISLARDTDFYEFMKAIQGKEGSVVSLTMISALDGSRYNCEITRELVRAPKMRVRAERISLPLHIDAEQYRIGYIDIPCFYEKEIRKEGPAAEGLGSSDDVKVALEELKAKGVDVVVIDLSRNPGGLGKEAANIAKLFMNRDNFSMFFERDRMWPQSSDEKTLWDGPVVLMTSRFSASGSEMLAAAFKAYKRGLIVGETTYGKGTSQRIEFLQLSGSNIEVDLEIKYTHGQFLAPDLSVIQSVGVVPDIEVTSSTGSSNAKQVPYVLDALETPVRRDLVEYDLVNDSILEELREASYLRRTMIAQRQVLEDLAIATGKNEQKPVPLSREGFMDWYNRRVQFSGLSPVSVQRMGREPRGLLTNPATFEVCKIAVEYLKKAGTLPTAKADLELGLEKML